MMNSMWKRFTVDSKVSLPEYEQVMKDVVETEFLVLKSKNGGEVLVSRKREIIFHWQDYEGLYHMVDFYFVEARWVEVSVHRNDTDTSMQIKRTLGGRVNRDKPALEALLRVQAQRILANNAFKASALAPSSQEASTEYTMELKPGTTLITYQRMFVFHVHEWFCSDSWAILWKLGEDNPSLTSNIYVPVYMDEYICRTHNLEGTGKIEVPGAFEHVEGKWRDVRPKRFLDGTDKCKEALQGPGHRLYYA